VSGGDWAIEVVARVERSKWALRLLGIGLVVALVATVAVIVAAFLGKFTSYVPVSAVLPSGSNAVEIGSPVLYRDVTVGKVASSGSLLASGRVRVDLHITPNQIANIPADVTASIVPVTLFGTQSVVLEPPAVITAARLSKGTSIPVVTGGTNASIQDTVTSLYDVLDGLHPAQLDQALTALSQALAGQGKSLGQSLVTADRYLQKILPQFPTAEADLALLAPVANQVAASSPDILSTLANVTLTAKTLTAQQSELHQFLTGATGASTGAYALLDATQSQLEALIADTAPLLEDLALTPDEIPSILAGLNQWATAWSAAESQGPYLSFSTSVPISNATDLVLAAVGAPNAPALVSGALDGRVNPATYTAADCPSYGTLRGNCSGATASSADAVIESPPIVDPNAEQAGINTIVRAGGGTPSSSPGLTTLLLGGLLASGATK
jgi:phospholipid/cholesterol/gamma-HCH transport system substrate-binding protein